MAKNATSKFRVASSAYLCTMIRVGIIGGGQLGMMTIEAKFPSLPVEFVVLEQSADCPAAPISNQFIAGSLKSEADIRTLAEASDVLTWEIEHITSMHLSSWKKKAKPSSQNHLFYRPYRIKASKSSFFNNTTYPPPILLCAMRNQLPRRCSVSFQANRLSLKHAQGVMTARVWPF